MADQNKRPSQSESNVKETRPVEGQRDLNKDQNQSGQKNSDPGAAGKSSTRDTQE